MIPLAILQVFYKQIKAQTGCDKVELDCGEDFVSITIIKLTGKDVQQLKKLFRWTAINQFTLNRVVAEFNSLYPPTSENESSDD